MQRQQKTRPEVKSRNDDDEQLGAGEGDEERAEQGRSPARTPRFIVSVKSPLAASSWFRGTSGRDHRRLAGPGGKKVVTVDTRTISR